MTQDAIIVGGGHGTNVCEQLDYLDEIKCCNCGEAHKASWRFCKYYELACEAFQYQNSHPNSTLFKSYQIIKSEYLRKLNSPPEPKSNENDQQNVTENIQSQETIPKSIEPPTNDNNNFPPLNPTRPNIKVNSAPEPTPSKKNTEKAESNKSQHKTKSSVKPNTIVITKPASKPTSIAEFVDAITNLVDKIYEKLITKERALATIKLVTGCLMNLEIDLNFVQKILDQIYDEI